MSINGTLAKRRNSRSNNNKSRKSNAIRALAPIEQKTAYQKRHNPMTHGHQTSLRSNPLSHSSIANGTEKALIYLAITPAGSAVATAAAIKSGAEIDSFLVKSAQYAVPVLLAGVSVSKLVKGDRAEGIGGLIGVGSSLLLNYMLKP